MAMVPVRPHPARLHPACLLQTANPRRSPRQRPRLRGGPSRRGRLWTPTPCHIPRCHLCHPLIPSRNQLHCPPSPRAPRRHKLAARPSQERTTRSPRSLRPPAHARVPHSVIAHPRHTAHPPSTRVGLARHPCPNHHLHWRPRPDPRARAQYPPPRSSARRLASQALTPDRGSRTRARCRSRNARRRCRARLTRCARRIWVRGRRSGSGRTRARTVRRVLRSRRRTSLTIYRHM